MKNGSCSDAGASFYCVFMRLYPPRRRRLWPRISPIPAGPEPPPPANHGSSTSKITTRLINVTDFTLYSLLYFIYKKACNMNGRARKPPTRPCNWVQSLRESLCKVVLAAGGEMLKFPYCSDQKMALQKNIVSLVRNTASCAFPRVQNKNYHPHICIKKRQKYCSWNLKDITISIFFSPFFRE